MVEGLARWYGEVDVFVDTEVVGEQAVVCGLVMNPLNTSVSEGRFVGG